MLLSSWIGLKTQTAAEPMLGALELQPESREAEGTLRDREGGVHKSVRTAKNWVGIEGGCMTISQDMYKFWFKIECDFFLSL